MVTSPKLENFFGGTTMGTHQYEASERGGIALSLDSMYYHQNLNLNPESNNCQDFINNPQGNNTRQQQQQQIQVQQYPDYSAFRGYELYQRSQETKETQLAETNLQLPTVADDDISTMKNWVSRNYTVDHAVEHKITGCIGGDNGRESGSLGAMGYGDLQSLSLSMSPGSQSSCITGSQQISPALADCMATETKKRGSEKVDHKQIVHRKSIDTFGQRTSQYRGVTRLDLFLPGKL